MSKKTSKSLKLVPLSKKSNRSSLYLAGFIILSASIFATFKIFIPTAVPSINETRTTTYTDANGSIVTQIGVYTNPLARMAQRGCEAKYTYNPKTDNCQEIRYSWGIKDDHYCHFGPSTSKVAQQFNGKTCSQYAKEIYPDSYDSTCYGESTVSICGAKVLARRSPTPTPTSATYDVADLNHDGKVDQLDYNLFMENYNKK